VPCVVALCDARLPTRPVACCVRHLSHARFPRCHLRAGRRVTRRRRLPRPRWWRVSTPSTCGSCCTALASRSVRRVPWRRSRPSRRRWWERRCVPHPHTLRPVCRLPAAALLTHSSRGRISGQHAAAVAPPCSKGAQGVARRCARCWPAMAQQRPARSCRRATLLERGL